MLASWAHSLGTTASLNHHLAPYCPGSDHWGELTKDAWLQGPGVIFRPTSTTSSACLQNPGALPWDELLAGKVKLRVCLARSWVTQGEQQVW